MLAVDLGYYWVHRMAHGMSHTISATTGYIESWYATSCNLGYCWVHRMPHGMSHMISVTTGYIEWLMVCLTRSRLLLGT